MTQNDKIVTIHQPQYIPYLGFFNKISESDIFIVLDDVSIDKGGFTNRNRIKTLNGPIWITIPLVRNNKIIKNIKIENTFWIKAFEVSTLITTAMLLFTIGLCPL